MPPKIALPGELKLTRPSSTGENASRAADRLFLQRNTIPYRLARVEELIGLDLNDYQPTLALRLSLLANEEERRRHR